MGTSITRDGLSELRFQHGNTYWFGRNNVHSADDILISHNDGKPCQEQLESPKYQV